METGKQGGEEERKTQRIYFRIFTEKPRSNEVQCKIIMYLLVVKYFFFRIFN